MPMNAHEIPREVSLHPPKNPFQIDESDKVLVLLETIKHISIPNCHSNPSCQLPILICLSPLFGKDPHIVNPDNFKNNCYCFHPDVNKRCPHSFNTMLDNLRTQHSQGPQKAEDGSSANYHEYTMPNLCMNRP